MSPLCSQPCDSLLFTQSANHGLKCPLWPVTCSSPFSFSLSPLKVYWTSSLNKPSTYCFMPFEDPSFWMILLLDVPWHLISFMSLIKQSNQKGLTNASYSPPPCSNFLLSTLSTDVIYLCSFIINIILLSWHLKVMILFWLISVSLTEKTMCKKQKTLNEYLKYSHIQQIFTKSQKCARYSLLKDLNLMKKKQILTM